MAVYPGAVFKPTPHGGKVKRNRQGRGMLHVAVSNAKSLPPSSNVTWHLYIAKAAPDGSTDGSGGPAYCEQYVDTDFRAYGGADGNDDQLIIETAGGLGTSAVLNAEPWTRAQQLRIIDFMRWEATQPLGAPLEVLPDARPGRRGWGPHRLGIKHSGGPRPGWWQPGCELWSNALGKECPGDTKVAQIPGLVTEARTGSTEEDDDMRDPEDQRKLDETYRMVALLCGVQLGDKSPNEKFIGQQVSDATIDSPGLRELTGGPQALSPVLAEVFVNSRASLALLSALAARPAGDVDEAGLAAALAPLFTAQVTRLSPEGLADVAKAVADEQDRRARDGDPATGPVS